MLAADEKSVVVVDRDFEAAAVALVTTHHNSHRFRKAAVLSVVSTDPIMYKLGASIDGTVYLVEDTHGYPHYYAVDATIDSDDTLECTYLGQKILEEYAGTEQKCRAIWIKQLEDSDELGRIKIHQL